MNKFLIMALFALSLAACSGASKVAPIGALGEKSSAPVGVQAGNPPAPVARAGEPAAPTPAAAPAQMQALEAGNMKVTPLQSGDAASAKPVVVAPPPQPPVKLVKPAERIIRFDYDSAALPTTAQPLVEQHATWLRAHPAEKTIIQGHADDRGSREYNLALGQKRAESVRQALGLIGVSEAQMEAVSLGEEKPLVEGDTESAWQQNRRAEIHYQGE